MISRCRNTGFIVVATTLLLGLGCSGRTLGGPGNNNNGNSNLPDGGVLPDAAPQPDAGPTICESEQLEWLRPWRIDSLYPMQDTPSTEGKIVRIGVGVIISGCQRLAKVDYRVEPSLRAIYVTAYVWETTGPQVMCPDMEMYVEEVLAFSGLVTGEWTVTETTSGVVGAETSFEVNVCDGNADCFCSTVPPGNGGYGSACNFDCECDPSLQCVGHWGMGGPFSICAHTCNGDADCFAGEMCMYTDDGPWAVCEPITALNQCPAEGCAPGFDCLFASDGSAWCQASFDMSDEGVPCSCPADCPTGLTCVDFGGDAVPSCHAPCRGDRDCPGGMCGDYLPDTPPICILMWM